MRNPVVILAILYGGLWLSMASPARAQSWNPYSPSAVQNRYSSPSYTPSPVSPYLNLGVNSNGFSNYQTLVKPMVEQREFLTRESANLQQLRQQMTDSRGRQDPREADRRNPHTQPQPAVRRMYYSHFFTKSP